GLSGGNLAIPRIAHGDVRELSRVVGADVTAPLAVTLQDRAPRLIVGEGGRRFLAVGVRLRGRETRPSVAAVAHRAEIVGVDAHLLEHLERAASRGRPRAEESDRQPDLRIELRTQGARLLESGDVAGLADEDAGAGRVLDEMERVARASRRVARARSLEDLRPRAAEGRVVEERHVGSRLDVKETVH